MALQDRNNNGHSKDARVGEGGGGQGRAEASSLSLDAHYLSSRSEVAAVCVIMDELLLVYSFISVLNCVFRFFVSSAAQSDVFLGGLMEMSCCKENLTNQQSVVMITGFIVTFVLFHFQSKLF